MIFLPIYMQGVTLSRFNALQNYKSWNRDLIIMVRWNEGDEIANNLHEKVGILQFLGRWSDGLGHGHYQTLRC